MNLPGTLSERSVFCQNRPSLRDILTLNHAVRHMLARSDLSFYNWDTQHSTSNESPNFQILPDHEQGLLFKNKRDRKAGMPACHGNIQSSSAKLFFNLVYCFSVFEGCIEDKVISVDPRSEPGDNSKRLEVPGRQQTRLPCLVAGSHHRVHSGRRATARMLLSTQRPAP